MMAQQACQPKGDRRRNCYNLAAGMGRGEQRRLPTLGMPHGELRGTPSTRKSA
jgi:hypothetical protein